MTPEDRALAAQTRRELANGAARARRLAAGIGLADMAAALDVPGDLISGWEHGQGAPQDRQAADYGQALALIVEVRGELASGVARRRREATRISLSEFAAVIGVSPAAVSQWERQDEDGRPVRVPGAKHALAYGRELAALERRAA